MKNLILILAVLISTVAISQDTFLDGFKESKNVKWNKKIHLPDGSYLFCVKPKATNVDRFKEELAIVIFEMGIDIDISNMDFEKAVNSWDMKVDGIFFSEDSDIGVLEVVVYYGDMYYDIVAN